MEWLFDQAILFILTQQHAVV